MKTIIIIKQIIIIIIVIIIIIIITYKCIYIKNHIYRHIYLYLDTNDYPESN